MPECLIDERLQSEAQVPVVFGEQLLAAYESLAQAVIDCREILTTGMFPMFLRKDFDFACLLGYGCKMQSRRKRTPVDVDKLVEAWMPQLKKLALAHDVDEKDAASSALDELLQPIISAPIAQIRQFYRQLVATMKADPQVPWCLWRLFEFWGANVLDKITKEGELKLKTELATKIAEMSMEEIPRADWINSMVGALQWRAPEKLDEIKAGLDAGHKPRVRGKESCLFLQVGEAQVML